MRVIVKMEIETPDYGGIEFKKEIEKLLEDIRVQAGDKEGALRLTSFKMHQKNIEPMGDQRDIDWEDK